MKGNAPPYLSSYPCPPLCTFNRYFETYEIQIKNRLVIEVCFQPSLTEIEKSNPNGISSPSSNSIVCIIAVSKVTNRHCSLTTTLHKNTTLSRNTPMHGNYLFMLFSVTFFARDFVNDSCSAII